MAAIANEELGNTEIAKNQFLELLQTNQEIVTNNIANNSPFQGFLGSHFEQAMPQAATDLMSIITEAVHYAYGYRRQGSGVYGWTTSQLQMPTDLESCHKYALSHLCEISLDFSQEEKDGLRRQLERIGVENAKFLMAGLSQSDIQLTPLVLLEIDPDSETALAVVLVNMVSKEDELPPEVCVKAFETFKKSFPGLALFAAIKMDQTMPENQTRLQEAVDRLKTIEEPNFLLVSFIAQRFYRPLGVDESDPLEKHRGALNQLLLDWYPKLQKHPQMSVWAFGVVASSLHEEKSPQRLIEFFDQELAQNNKQSKSQPNFSGFFGGYQMNQGQDILLPSYPPTGLISFPDTIYAQLEMPKPDDSSNRSSRGFTYSSGNERVEMPLDQIAVAVGAAEDPTMKVLLELKYFYKRDQQIKDLKTRTAKPVEPIPDSIKTIFGDQVTDAKSAIDQLLEASKTNVDAWYLAGALAVSEKRWADAANNFETMRNLPMTAEIRRKIDGHLVALATIGLARKLNAEKYEKVVMSAKSAALRLRRGTLSQDQRVQLVSAFEKLELNDEAKEMEVRIAKATKAGATFQSRAAVASVSADRIIKLNRAGKSDAAARLLLQEFYGIARQELDLNSMDNYSVRTFKSKVEEYGLENQLVKLLDPGETTSTRKLGSWAIAQEIYGKKSTAKSAYKKLLEVHPQENAARLRYIMLDPKETAQLFTLEFPKISKRFRHQFLDEDDWTNGQQAV